MPFAISDSRSPTRMNKGQPPFPSQTTRLSEEFKGAAENSGHASLNQSSRMDEDKASRVITNFFRRMVAARSYHHMFSNGSQFATKGLKPPRAEINRYPLAPLTHLKKMSAQNLALVTERVGKLSADEVGLQQNILASEWGFQHQSPVRLDNNGVLKISSNHLLKKNGTAFKSNTPGIFLSELANNDFVFFSVEFSGGHKKGDAPLSQTHATEYYGKNSYIIDEEDPRCHTGYLTLTDHLDTRVPPPEYSGNAWFISKFPNSSRKIHRNVVLAIGGKEIAPIYSFQDMKKAVSLHLISFLRGCNDAKLNKFAFHEVTSSSAELHQLLNTVYQCEFHIPRIVGTTTYTKHNLSKQDLFLESLCKYVETSNVGHLNYFISDKKTALAVMFDAVSASKTDLVAYLFKRWNLNADDFLNHVPNDPNVTLMNVLFDSASAIVTQFKERNLIDAVVSNWAAIQFPK